MSAPYEVPSEMRDFAERSVSQARRAFESFMGAVQRTSGSIDTAASSAQVTAKDVTGKAVSFAEKNVTAAFDLAERLVRAKDVHEVLQIQSEFVRAQMETIQAQTKELGEAVQKAAGVKSDQSF